MYLICVFQWFPHHCQRNPPVALESSQSRSGSLRRVPLLGVHLPRFGRCADDRFDYVPLHVHDMQWTRALVLTDFIEQAKQLFFSLDSNNSKQIERTLSDVIKGQLQVALSHDPKNAAGWVIRNSFETIHVLCCTKCSMFQVVRRRLYSWTTEAVHFACRGMNCLVLT